MAGEVPGPAQMREQIAALGVVEKKVLGGMILLMIKNHDRVRDREWVAENFTRLSVPALGLDAQCDVDQDLDAVKDFVTASMDSVLNRAFPLFARVAADLSTGPKAGSFGYEDACAQAMSYFASAASEDSTDSG